MFPFFLSGSIIRKSIYILRHNSYHGSNFPGPHVGLLVEDPSSWIKRSNCDPLCPWQWRGESGLHITVLLPQQVDISYVLFSIFNVLFFRNSIFLFFYKSISQFRNMLFVLPFLIFLKYSGYLIITPDMNLTYV